jgi:hypothetical protein
MLCGKNAEILCKNDSTCNFHRILKICKDSCGVIDLWSGWLLTVITRVVYSEMVDEGIKDCRRINTDNTDL